ncbi:MAG: hypothetical protein LBC12_06215 [Nitrososphaerota archaeon]|nr:hypothetical protein [Nitrososphaerota archaeon]
MKQMKIFIAVVILLLLTGTMIITGYTMLNNEAKQSQDKEFYVGVTYCGNSTQEAKELIDKVKNYTNLFVLLSEPLWWNTTVIEEIGDYAIASGLNYAVSGTTTTAWVNWWLNDAKERWGEQFIGTYYNDERGGNMLDGRFVLEDTITRYEGRSIGTSPRITKSSDGGIMINDNAVHTTTYYPEGTIYRTTHVYDKEISKGPISAVSVNYYPNGTITIYENLDFSGNHNFYTAENITKYQSPIQSYKEILKQNPVQTPDDAAKAFVNANKATFEDYFLNKTQLEESILVFTSDYGLYWWDC